LNLEGFRSYCLSKPGVTEEFPFGDDVMVMKVLGKMFAAADVELFESINLKCDPERAVELREQYAGVVPGYHMNKKHWNTVMMDGTLPDKLVMGWIDDSYQLVCSTLPKAQQKKLFTKK
jgi:predicted DNA-binding protein (MmcQ/YjbR family)